MSISLVSNSGNEETDQEYEDDEDNECDGVFESTPKFGAKALDALLLFNLIIFFVVEVGERYDDEAQQSVEAVERIVHDLQSEEDVFDAFGSGPVLLRTEGGRGRGGDQGDIDWQQQDRCKEGC